MKNTYRTILDLPNVDAALLILRLGVAGMMLTHGWPKLINLFGSEEISFGDPIGIGAAASLTLVVFAEFICSILIGIGLGTRLAVIPLLITMLVAILIVHSADPFNVIEKPLLYTLIYIVLLFTGSGKYSLDQYFLKGK